MEGCLLLFKQLRPVMGMSCRLSKLPTQYLSTSLNSTKHCSYSTSHIIRGNLLGSSAFRKSFNTYACAGLFRRHHEMFAVWRNFSSKSVCRIPCSLHSLRGPGSSLLVCGLGQGRPRLVAMVRLASGQGVSEEAKRKRSMLIYICAVGIFMLGMSYAGVPLYRMFCQATGLGGQAVKGHDTEKVETMQKVDDRIIRVRFNADVAASMRWNFRPQQTEVKVLPGETALAFYTAKNPTAKPIVGISTYNVVPFEAGQYFNKIQCFCFEEQRLNPNEQVDMPVFFYIDPDFASDPKLQHVDTITLSYTFFEAKEGLQLPLPGYATT